MINEFIKELESIASKINDRWKYNIEIAARGSNIRFIFSVVEAADRHEWLAGSGLTVEDAVLDAKNKLRSSFDYFYGGIATFPE